MAENIEVGGVVAKISMDDTGVNQSMAKLTRQMKLVQSEFAAASAKLSAHATEEEKLRVKSDSLTKQISIQEQKVAALRARHDEAATAKGKDAKETQNLAVQLSKAQAQLSGMQNDLHKTNDEIKQQTSMWKKLHDTLDTSSQKIKNVGQSLSSMGRSLSLTVTAPILAIGGAAVKSSIDFESAFAGVKKTVNATEQEMSGFRQGIRDMAKEVPVAATEIAKVAESAGQLGVQNKALMSFTRTMIDLGVSTNLSADQAATAMARIANITQMPQENFGRLGATVVALGNAGASTEQEIVDMSLRIAGAGHQVGMTQAQILGIANALSSVGIEAESGGSSVSTTMINIAKSVATGGEKLELFSRVAGMSAKDFKQKFKTDAAGALVDFIEGIKKVGDAGGNTFAVLDALGLSEIRVRDSLLRASGAGDLFRQSLETGNKAWQENTALTNEANQRYGTTESKWEIFVNQLKDIAMTLGDALVPALMSLMDAAKPLIDMLANMAKWFSGLDASSQKLIIGIAAIAAAIGPVLLVLGMLTTAVGTLISPIGLIVVGVAALAAGAAIVIANWGPISAWFKDLWDKISAVFNTFWSWLKNFMGGWGGTLLTVLLPFIGIPLQIITHWNQIKDGLVKAWNAAVAAVKPIVTFFVAEIVKLFTSLRDGVMQIFNGIKTFFAGAWELVKTIFLGAMLIIYDIVTGRFDRLKTDAAAIWGRVKDSFSKIWDGVKQIFSGALQIISGYFTFWWDVAKKSVEKGIDWLKQLPSQILELGKHIIQGLIDGIGSMKDAVVKKVKEVASSIGGGIKDFFGISSPSKLTTQYGANIMEGLSFGIDKGAKKAAASAKKAASAAAKAIKDHFNTAFKETDFKLKMGQIDLSQFISSLQTVKSEYAKTGDQIRKIDLAIKSARDKIMKQQAVDEKKQFETSKQWIEQKRQANELSLGQELAAWERVQTRFKQGTKERAEAENNVLRVRKEIYDQLIKANEEYLTRTKEINANVEAEEKRLNAAYDQAVKDRAKAISDFSGLFDEVKVEADKTGQQLLDNLQGQVTYLETWSKSFQELSKRGVDQGLLEELRQMGPKATPELIALNQLTDEQLLKYQGLWKEKAEKSRSAAIDELKGLRTDTEKQIMELHTSAMKQLESLRTDFEAQMKGIRGDTTKEMSLLKKDMPTIGQQAMQGLMNGLNSMKGPLEATARSIATSISSTIRNALQVRSPSRVMMEIGAFTGEGLALGMNSSVANVIRQARALASAAIPSIGSVGSHGFAGGGISGSASRMGGQVHNHFHLARESVVISAKDLKEMQDVTDFFKKLPQVARSMGFDN